MTLQEAKNCRRGQTLFHGTLTNADGSPQRFKVQGKPKTWVTRPNEVQLSLKRGLWEFSKANEGDLPHLHATEEAAIASRAMAEAA